MDLGLTGKRALVMAASKGLGRAVAEELARGGAYVLVSSSSKDRICHTASEIQSATGSNCYGFEADMFDPSAMDRLADRVEDLVGSVDILVINHLGPALGLAQSINFEVLETHYRMMIVSPLRLIARFLPGMRTRRWGRILSIGGASIINALPNKAMDNIYRPALVNYTKALAAEVSADGVTANIILPGTFMTDRVRESTESNARLWRVTVEDAMRERIENIPAGRFGSLEEFASVAAFICSERASYITGSIVRVDGGQIKSIL